MRIQTNDDTSKSHCWDETRTSNGYVRYIMLQDVTGRLQLDISFSSHLEVCALPLSLSQKLWGCLMLNNSPLIQLFGIALSAYQPFLASWLDIKETLRELTKYKLKKQKWNEFCKVSKLWLNMYNRSLKNWHIPSPSSTSLPLATAPESQLSGHWW